MILKLSPLKVLFSFCLLAFLNPVFANLRAPWSISRYPSYSLPFVSSQLIVLKEDLVFICDKTFEGDGDLSKIKEQSCNVEATYFIQSNTNVAHTLEFVLPSEKPVSIFVNDSSIENTNSKVLQLTDIEKEGYRLSDLCRYCDENINQLYTVPFSAKFQTGSNTIRVTYKQPLSTSEIGYGYFQSSKWMHSFGYELWPLKEWKLDANFEMKIKFTTEVGGVWDRLVKRKIVAACNGIDLRFKAKPNLPLKKSLGANGYDEFYTYNQNLNPKYNLSEFSKMSTENNRLVYELTLKEIFPDRLNCYFGHEKN